MLTITKTQMKQYLEEINNEQSVTPYSIYMIFDLYFKREKSVL